MFEEQIVYIDRILYKYMIIIIVFNCYNFASLHSIYGFFHL